MRNLLKVALVAAGIMFMSNFAKAQTKIGHIAVDEVVSLMPELKTIETQMKAYQKEWNDTYAKFTEEYQKKVKEFQDGEKTMSDAVKATKVAELQDLEKRGGELRQNAETAIGNKNAELGKPLMEKIRTAISAVAKEKGYTYVINTSATDLIVAPDADNLLAAVKLKLGLK